MSRVLPRVSVANLPGGAVARRALLSAAAAGVLAALAFTSAGCSEPLLAARDERSPFDRYDAVRNQHAPQYVENKFGRRQPNLSGRLGPKK